MISIPLASFCAPCGELIKWLCKPVIRGVEDFIAFEDNKGKMIRKRDALVAKESDIRTQLERAAEQRNQQALEEVNLWQGRVEAAKNQIDYCLQPIATDNCFSKLKSKMVLSKLVVDVIQELDELKAENFSGGLACDAPAETSILFDPPPLRGQPTSTMNEIMELLLNSPEIGKIGVYGMGGVGKTTIMKNINNKLAEMSHFNRIIWVTISKEDGGISKIQKKIAQELGQGFDNKLSNYDDEEKRAGTLRRELKRIGKFLIILDDLWNEEITLEKVGIPQPNDENNCKVVVTTRFLKYCNSIEIQRNVEVECLSKEEAWDLFVSKVGVGNSFFAKNPKIKDVAWQMVGECGGLPLAIIAIGSAMRGKPNIKAWKHAWYQLQRLTTEESNDDLGMDVKVFKLLRYSYDELNPRAQKCFLYCAFYPEDYSISSDELIEYWVAEGYIKEEVGIDDQCDRWDEKEHLEGIHILEELKDACMLQMIEKGSGDELGVRMHDLIRDLALKIMRKEYEFLAKAGLLLTELSREEWENFKKISLIANEMDIFPEQLNCPRLTTLLLKYNWFYSYDSPLMRFPLDFFSQMPTLRVLDLSRCPEMDLSHASFYDLVELRYLNLNRTELLYGKLPEGMGALLNLRYLNLSCTRISGQQLELGLLVNLRYLNLSVTDIGEVPDEIGELFELRYLDVSDTRVQYLPPQVGRLLNLRHLDMHNTKIRELPEEMGALVNLRYLDISVTKIQELTPLVGILVNLRYLNIAVTKIQELTPLVGSLLNLRYLNLRGTKIRELPLEMVALVNLKDLDLVWTEIQELPLWLGDLVHLNVKWKLDQDQTVEYSSQPSEAWTNDYSIPLLPSWD